jgi:CRP-like cAMP-binding protein
VTSAELKVFALLGELSDEEREAVREELEQIDLGEGDVLFREGEEAHGLVLVVSGHLRLDSRRAGNLGLAGAGAAIGAASLISIGPRESTALAERPTRVFLLRRSAFRRLAEDMPRAACRLAEAVASELSSILRSGLDTFARPAVDPGEGDA